MHNSVFGHLFIPTRPDKTKKKKKYHERPEKIRKDPRRHRKGPGKTRKDTCIVYLFIIFYLSQTNR